MTEVDLMRRYPRAKRKLDKPRSSDPENVRKAREFGEAYFDGRREEGYGGYRYDGRWIPIAEDIVNHFGLKAGDKVLDVGCAKGFLMKDLKTVCPGLQVYGLDISDYALRHAEPEAHGRLVLGSGDSLPYADGAFDLVVSINTLHNFERPRLIAALREMERLAPGRGYVQVDAYRNEAEREHFLGWVLTALTFLKPDEWRALFAEAGYRGDYCWTILEMDPEWNDFGDAGEAEACVGAR
ncbi:MAG: methyltransferase domain-containing protein [Alphaproteobacteria bacterium]|nr:methyltransferase domain-containing protein [Alphaproteobacteria bacterium]